MIIIHRSNELILLGLNDYFSSFNQAVIPSLITTAMF